MGRRRGSHFSQTSLKSSSLLCVGLVRLMYIYNCVYMLAFLRQLIFVWIQKRVSPPSHLC